METSSVTGAASASTRSSQTQLAENFDNFLLLLTTQLEYQDPLEPLDTNQFTEQLVQFTNVEQAIETNSKLDELISLQGTNQLTAALDYIGKTVQADGSQVALSGGTGRVTYSLAENAQTVVIRITDATGQTVRTVEGPSGAGSHDLVWNGTDDQGNVLPNGTYGVTVAAADAQGGAVAVTQGTVGRVTGIQLENGEVILSLGDLEVPASRVISVRSESGGEQI